MAEVMDDMDLDLDGVDLDGVEEQMEIDGMDLSDFGEIDDSIDLPHVKVATKSLKEFLKVAKQVCSSGGRDIVSKAVCLKADPENGKLICKATDFDVYAEQKLELLNTENILTESIQVQTDILIKLTKAVPVNTIIYKKDDSFYIRLYGGDMVIENYTFPEEKFMFSDEVDKVDDIEAEDLYGMMKDLTPVVTAAVSPAERRVLCEKDKAFANYMWAIIMVGKSFSNFDLKVKDLSILKTLVMDKKEEQVIVYRTKPDNKTVRCVLEGSDFRYAFLVSEVSVSESMKDNISTVVTDKGVYVDFVQFYKMVEVASDLPYSIGKIGVNYSEEGIKVNIMTKKGGSNPFDIAGSIEGEIEPLKEELVVQAKLLRIVLRSFASKSSIRLTVSDKGLGIQSDDYRAALYSETKGK